MTTASLRVPVDAGLRRTALLDVPERVQRVPDPLPAPLLVPSSESVDEIGPEICARRPYWVTPVERPELRYPASCDTYLCTVCGPRKATQAAAVMTYALRNLPKGSRARFVTLTLAPQDWTQLRQKVRDARRILVREGYDWEWAWAREAGSKTGMLHLHGVQHGRHKIPQDRLLSLWGAGCRITAVKGLQDASGAVAYTVKESLRVVGYTTKGTDSLDEHLALNGGRPAHWSRGFLHGLTKREALTELRRELADGEPLTWRLVPAWETS